MKFKLCMAEKPSAAGDIARVVGADRRCEGYFEGEGYRVAWAPGHLVGLAEPDAYGYAAKKALYGDGGSVERAYEELPLIPESFRLVVFEPTRAQFEVIRRLIHDPEVTEVINCGDMGPEGHALQWFIREMAGCTKPVRCFCATSMTDGAIRRAMENLRREEDFAGIIRGEFCKRKADWMFGMSLSRCVSIKYHADICVGRMQSPTLHFVVRRYLDVRNYKEKEYFTMEAVLAEGFSVFWERDTEKVFPEEEKDSNNRLTARLAAEKKAALIRAGGSGTVTEVKTMEKKTERPQLYDITELQRDANRKYGYTAASTLAAAQALYETQKVLSCPRTDSRYLTSGLAARMPGLVGLIGSLGGPYASVAEMLLGNGLNLDGRVVDDTKAAACHALVPTEKIAGFDMDAMEPTAGEAAEGVTKRAMRDILELVLVRTLASLSTPYLYGREDVAVRFGDITFTAFAIKPVDCGWKGLQEYLTGEEPDTGNSPFPAGPDSKPAAGQGFPETLRAGQAVMVSDCIVKTKTTAPPKLHTEASLLTEMENAGSGIDNGRILKGRGIGTPATRAKIIRKLFDYGYCKTLTKGKTNYIVPTQKGLSVIRILPPELHSPKITAGWEAQIAEIAAGRMEEEEFLDAFKEFLQEGIDKIRESSAEISFPEEKKPCAACPWCGGGILRFQEEGKKRVRFICANRECSFGIDTENPIVQAWTGKKLTEGQCLELIRDGAVVLNCRKNTGTGTYRGYFELVRKEIDGKVYASLYCRPVRRGGRPDMQQ